MGAFFLPNQVLTIPQLSELLNITSNKFIVKQKFDGGMGTCYRIEDIDKKSYALKVIHPELLLDGNSKKRYIDEIKLWITFSACEGIAEAFYIADLNDIPCVVSKWMEYGDMNSIINSIDIKTFYRGFDRIISSLKWVNDNYNVIHRDLKPGNILIDKSKNFYVSDWGLAKLISNPDNNSNSSNKIIAGINPYLTQIGLFVGSIPYASPEQLLGLPNIDFRSDIYSLGCIMYQCETGRPPFVGNTMQEIATGHLYSKPEKIGGHLKSSCFKAESIIMKCLEKKPSERYQSYKDLLEDLHKIASENITDFVPYKVKLRHETINLGNGEFEDRIKKNDIGLRGLNGFVLVENEDIKVYLKEALYLSALGEHEKSISIYKHLFNLDTFTKSPDLKSHQYIAVNLAYEYNCINEPQKAINTILAISKAQQKPDTYYINLSQSYIKLSDYEQCLSICEEGLKQCPDDLDLNGNYTIALTEVGRLEEAVNSAYNRLSLGREVHSICEAALVLYKYAESLKNHDFPEAISCYKQSLSLFQEALSLNPIYKDALNYVPLLLFKMRRYTDSLKYGVEVSKIEKCTSHIIAYYAAQNMLWSNSFEAGLDFCNKWLKHYPESILLKRIRAEIIVDGFVIGHYTEDGNHYTEQSSLDFFSEIVKDKGQRKPQDIIYLAKIYCWMDEGIKSQYGLQLLEWGKREYPDNWKFNFYLAAFALNHKKLDKALEEAIEGKRKAPWREKMYELLANIYSAKGDNYSAQKMKEEHMRIKNEKDKLYDSCKEL